MLGGWRPICYCRANPGFYLGAWSFSKNGTCFSGSCACPLFGADRYRRQETVMSASSNPKPESDVESLFSATLREVDPEIANAIQQELGRQRDEIELIASENIVSRAVLEAQGSVLTNKYAEGLPGKRYYGGCQFVDIAERLAIERVTKLFGCKFANVQPHSGASANAEVFFALLQPGDTFMGLNLAAGGHLTHGSPVNMSGKWFKPVAYGVRRDDHRIDFDEVAKLAREHRP